MSVSSPLLCSQVVTVVVATRLKINICGTKLNFTLKITPDLNEYNVFFLLFRRPGPLFGSKTLVP